MEAITNVTHNQGELRALVERPRVENERPELMFEDVSMGQPRPNVDMNFVGPNFNDQRANGYDVHNNGMRGNFTPPPPPPYNYGEPHLIVGYMLGHPNARGNHQVQEMEVDRNEICIRCIKVT